MTGNEVAKATDNELREAIAQQEDDRLLELTESFLKFKNAGAPKLAIMDALGLSEDDYDKLNSRDEVKSAILEAETRRMETSTIMDAGWDTIENQAMSIVLEAVKYSKDPEYSLRAAAVANKAIRRRREDAKLANQMQVGEYKTVNNISVINLPKMLIQNLQNQTQQDINEQLELQQQAIATQKYIDVADVSTTNKILNVDKSPTEMIDGNKLDLSDKKQVDYLIEDMLNGKFK